MAKGNRTFSVIKICSKIHVIPAEKPQSRTVKYNHAKIHDNELRRNTPCATSHLSNRSDLMERRVRRTYASFSKEIDAVL